MNEYIIEVFSYEWTRNASLSLLFVTAFMLVGKYNSKKFNERFAKAASILLIFFFVNEHIKSLMNGNWMLIKNLPFQLCAISQLIACFILFIPKKQYLFDFFFYCGIIGGFMSIYTPQINFYEGSLYHYIEYYVAHLIIISLPLFLYYHLDFTLSKSSWLRSFLILNVLLVIIMPLNSLLGSNYMYLNEPPVVDNPFVMGAWPYYLLVLELVAAGLFFITYKAFTMKWVRSNN